MGWWEIDRERGRKKEGEGKRERELGEGENAGVEGRKRGAKSDVEERQSRGLRRTTRVEKGQWREGRGENTRRSKDEETSVVEA